jgi:hypothetical protein
MSWRMLSRTPGATIRVSTAAIQGPAACAALIAALRPAVDALSKHAHQSSAEDDVDYQSLPLRACGPEAIALVSLSGLDDHAALATGEPARAGEDIMVARTRSTQQGGRRALARPGVLNVHHDRHHSKDGRVATFMVYLTTLDPKVNGGETYLPAANAPENDSLAQALHESYLRGERYLSPKSALGMRCEHRLEAWRQSRQAHSASPDRVSSVGVGVAAMAGHALVFDAGVNAGAWHAPCRVSGVCEKWTLTWFKAPAPQWSTSLLGV